MNANDFANLYTKRDTDEKITEFNNETGFSLIRQYPRQSPYFKDGRKMFIKVAVLARGLFFSVDMTKPEKSDEETIYSISDGEEYKKRVTNFISDVDSKEFMFNEQSSRFLHTKTGKEFTMNEFIDLLVRNHLSDRLFLKRKFNTLATTSLQILFWLVDRRYDQVKVMIDVYHFRKENVREEIEVEKDPEPFFRYFFIKKNFLFVMLLVSLFMMLLVRGVPNLYPFKSVLHSYFGEFSLGNPIIVLFLFLILSASEKLSLWLNTSIKEFLMPAQDSFGERKQRFIEKLHNYQFHNKFNLKIN